MNVSWILELAVVLLVLVGLGRLLGTFARGVGQPRVMGEILAGILIGPSVLGRVPGAENVFTLDASLAQVLALIAGVAIVLYMFIIAIEFNLERIRGRVVPLVAVALGSITIPLLTGVALAGILYPRAPPGVAFGTFAFFIGIATAITAFPVLARILEDRGLTDTRLGATALTCAAVNDSIAWILVAVLIGTIRHEAAGFSVIALAGSSAAILWLLVRPAVANAVRLAERGREWPIVVVAMASVAAAALAAENIGLHAILGAFALGLTIPHDSRAARVIVRRTRPISAALLPAFFALSGFRTDLGLLASPGDWLLLLLITAAATAAKLGGTTVVARIVGFGWSEATRLGVLMNTRGLMELIVLNIGLDLGLLSPTLFTMFIFMALATTAATGPALHLIDWAAAPSRAHAEQAAPQGSRR